MGHRVQRLSLESTPWLPLQVFAVITSSNTSEQLFGGLETAASNPMGEELANFVLLSKIQSIGAKKKQKRFMMTPTPHDNT